MFGLDLEFGIKMMEIKVAVINATDRLQKLTRLKKLYFSGALISYNKVAFLAVSKTCRFI